ncbi:hypothetical protein [Caballeronia humi]|uniref:hypothetical protein n=1 Tax=Caballeronia humi TaxID=326474 RepID=UPI000AA1EAB3|nr:hypothetical protein [Caballeronia humi]
MGHVVLLRVSCVSAKCGTARGAMTAAIRLSRDGDPVMGAAGVFAGEVGIGASVVCRPLF